MNSIRKAFADYTEGLASQKGKLTKWTGETGPFKTKPHTMNDFVCEYTYHRANSDYEDYETYSIIPYEYMETEDYVEWLADYRFKKELEEKAKKKVKLEEDLRNKEYTLKRNKEEVEELKKRLLNS